MKFTRVRDLIGIAAVVTALAWLIIQRWYGELPQFRWFMPLSLVLLAVVEFFAGLQLRARVRQKPGSPPLNPLAAARELALAKASAWVGAATFGAWTGLLIYTVPRANTVTAARQDSVTGAIGVAASIVLVAAALWLEHCCRSPKPPEDQQNQGDNQR